MYDPEEGHWNYTFTADPEGNRTVDALIGEGNLTTYRDRLDLDGTDNSTVTRPSGEESYFIEQPGSAGVAKSPMCGLETEFVYDYDSRYYTKYIKEVVETISNSPLDLVRTTRTGTTYGDTNFDDLTDLITGSITVNNHTTTSANDLLLGRVTVTSPEGRTTTTDYDTATLLPSKVSVTGLLAGEFGYDTRGRLTSLTTGARETTFAYNNAGFLDRLVDPAGRTTSYTYDTVGRATGVSRPDGSRLGFTYDANGNLTVLTNPAYVDHSFASNGVNQPSAYTTPLSGDYSYTYDLDRRPLQTRFPSGKTISYVYDTSRLSQVSTPEGNIAYTYLCSDKVGTITKGSESISYDYDGPLVTSETLAGAMNQTLSFTWNNDFDLVTFTYGGATENYSYDNDGLLTGAGAFSIGRDIDNGLPLTVSDGTGSVNRTFNGYGEMAGVTASVGGNTVSSWSATRDNTGRIVTKTETVDGVTANYAYTYDAMGRLLTATKDGIQVEEYQYDTTGTRTYERNDLRGIAGCSAAYDDEEKLLTSGDTTYVYDTDGFLVSKIDGAVMTSYDYSSRGELLGVNLPDGKAITYKHDPLGRRIAKLVNGVAVEKYLWSGQTTLLAIYDGSNNLVMRFEYADGRMPMAMTKNGTSYYLTYDQVGSLRAVVNAAGNVVKRIDYDSFGNVIADSNPLFEIPFGFAGGLHDRDTGLVRFGHRDYDPDTGRWTAKDPILFAGGDTDLYGYVQNNPVNFVDPEGQFYIAAAIIHWTRNYWNAPVKDISDVNDWTQLTPDESIYHKMGPGNENNRKFVSTDGHSEAVFDSDDCLVADSANIGTFNFFGPRTFGGVPHLIVDVLPYFVLGNSPSDMFNMDRFSTTAKHLSK